METKKIDNFIITNQKLGEGSFGLVYRGYLSDDKAQLLAVKQIEIKKLKGDLKLLKRELDLLNMLEGPGIVKFYKPMRTEKNLYFFMEYCETDLKKYIKSKAQGYLSEGEAISFFRNICDGFKILQQNNVIHRDIKPANILIKNGQAKLTDFGFARIVESVDEKEALTFLGSPLYMSPQILAKKDFSSKCDVWSAGMTLYETLYGKTPWTAGNIPSLLENIKTKKLDFPPHPHRSKEIKELLSQMLAVNEQQRISWNDIFLHELVTGIHSKKVQQKLQEISSSQVQNLEKSFTINQLYITNNKVLNQTHNIESLDESALSRKQSEKEKVGSTDAEGDFKYQEMRRKQEETIEKVDSYFRYRRNLLVFVNITTNNFYVKCRNALPQSLFFIGVFMLQKFQVAGYHELLDIFNGKKQLDKFQEFEWKLYKASNSYWKTLKSLKTDDKYLMPYFKEVLNKSLRYFDKNPIEQEFLTMFKIFKEQHNEKIHAIDLKAYESVIEYIITFLKKEKVEPSFIRSLEICRRPYEVLKPETDFYRLYEDDEKVQFLQKQ